MGWPGKAEAGHASRSSGLVQITAARCANGRAKPWAVNLNARLASRMAERRRRTGEWRWRTQRCREDSSSHASSGMINTSTHTITHMKMPYSYTRQAPLLRFSEFRFTVYVSPSTNRKRDS